MGVSSAKGISLRSGGIGQLVPAWTHQCGAGQSRELSITTQPQPVTCQWDELWAIVQNRMLFGGGNEMCILVQFSILPAQQSRHRPCPLVLVFMCHPDLPGDRAIQVEVRVLVPRRVAEFQQTGHRAFLIASFPCSFLLPTPLGTILCPPRGKQRNHLPHHHLSTGDSSSLRDIHVAGEG